MKTNNPPGIFNDVIGPVMRGPSSSHTAGSHRIGSIIRQLAESKILKVNFLFHPDGSLASTYHTQGSDIGLAAGLLGLDMSDPNLPKSLELAKEAGLNLSFIISDYPANHPNTYLCQIELKNGQVFELTALSVGGGIIEITNIQGFDCNSQMDLPSLLVIGDKINVLKWWKNIESSAEIIKTIFKHQMVHKQDQTMLFLEFNVANPKMEDPDIPDALIKFFKPVYPTMGYTGRLLPFRCAGDLEKLPMLENKDIADLAVEYECKRSAITSEEVFARMDSILDILMLSIDKGLSGTEYKDRIAHAQSPYFLKQSQKGKLIPAGPLDKMAAYTMAIMEAKSAMEVIVAAPTAGSAGGLPGALIGLAEEMKVKREDLIKSFLAAGLIGVFISAEATFAAEVAGCQAETGAGAAMAAAGMISLAGGSAKQALDAASMALQNIMGLVCDPVANRVEIPCLGRNVQAGANALTSANLILGGVKAFIPLSESIQTMLAVGKALPRELRCTALGGLSITKTAKNIEKYLDRNKTD